LLDLEGAWSGREQLTLFPRSYATVSWEGGYADVVGQLWAIGARSPLSKSEVAETSLALRSKGVLDSLELHDVTRNGQFVVLAHLLMRDGLDVSRRDQTGSTALHYSSSPEASLLLVRAGAEVDARDGSGCTPLHVLASGGGKSSPSETICDCMKTLVSLGADASTSDADGTPALKGALDYRLEFAECLLSLGADPNDKDGNGNPLICDAAMWSSIEEAHLLLEHGADPNVRSSLVDDDEFRGWYPLHFAAWFLDWSMAETLLQHGASNDVRSEDGDRPSDIARKSLKVRIGPLDAEGPSPEQQERWLICCEAKAREYEEACKSRGVPSLAYFIENWGGGQKRR